ncbi:hypothetical protein AURDEDRAFT_123541 [Auricularia subglabra TFB-10046 SS5]|nr:hypothetical protein AURDEDRAFT_123541 [Auricularia subglabra TFB-10046 SS5]
MLVEKVEKAYEDENKKKKTRKITVQMTGGVAASAPFGIFATVYRAIKLGHPERSRNRSKPAEFLRSLSKISLNRPVLRAPFLKLYKLGMRGPMFDIYRTIYERMLYCVRLGGERGEDFSSDMDILIGDQSMLTRRRCPPTTVRRLYTAVFDPHLTHGCDVSPDATKRATLQLEQTGIWPIRYRRADLLMRYTGYLLQRPTDDCARLALADSTELFRSGKQCWFSDAHRALLQMPYSIDLGPNPVEDAGAQSAVNPKLVLLQCRPSENCVSAGTYGAAPVMDFRGYLKPAIPEHRTALTRVLLPGLSPRRRFRIPTRQRVAVRPQLSASPT